MKQKVYPWLIVVAWAFISAGSIELILIGGSNFFKAVSDGIGSPVSAIALMMTVCTITLTFAAPVAGRLFPKIDSRILLSAMGIIVILGYAQLSFGQAAWQWWLAGLLYGVGGSGIFIIGAPIFIANWFQKRTGFAVGLYGMLLAILSAILNPCIAAVISAVGWRSAYLVLAVVAAVMILPWTLFVVRFKPEQLGLKPFGYVEGESLAAENEEESGPGVPYKKALLSVAFVAAVIAAGAMCNMGGFKSNWSNIAQSEAWGFVALHGADWALMFGATMISFTTAAKFFMPVIGWVIDKIGAIKTNVLTLALIFVGFLGLLFFHNVEAVVLASCFLIGFESANMKMVIPLVIRELFGAKDHSKIYSTAYGIANFLGACATSLIAFVGETTGSFDSIMVLGAGLAAVSILAIVVAKATAKKLVWED